MALAETQSGALYYEVIDRVVPWEERRDPILFHHGIAASSGIWTEWIAAPADRHPIVTFDMRRHGRSAIPPAEFAFTAVSVAAEIHRLLPGAELNVFGPARHGLPFSHAAPCAALLRSFLARRYRG